MYLIHPPKLCARLLLTILGQPILVRSSVGPLVDVVAEDTKEEEDEGYLQVCTRLRFFFLQVFCGLKKAKIA